jgi:MoaA/NifB/PqqE/SkfB family radical SAM enzyme
MHGRQRNRLREAAHFLRSYFSPRPSYLILFVTAVCNARCRHCFYWREVDSASPADELSLAEIHRIARSLRLIYLSIGGGEPFLRPDLAQIAEAFYDESGILFCNIVTNGSRPAAIANTVREIRARCERLVIKVQVSVDDFAAGHDALRGFPGLYDKALSTLEQLSALAAADPRLRVDVATCMTAANRDRVVALAADLRKRLTFDYHQLLYPRGPARDPGQKQVEPDEWLAALEAIGRLDPRRRSRWLASVNDIAKRGVYGFLKRGDCPWRCLAGRKFISITERGILQPCEVLGQEPPEGGGDLATLRDFDFSVPRALGSPRARELVRWVRRTRCRCSFECAANCNVVFSPRQALRVLKAMAAHE